ncbi:Uu.00g012530.m01.CDS01 [Anthostomella pinea]|uniref:Uu.00g012530.m01.CDS01 n=1 Tax=Anthostomella pinea TaxID=933095 RepID=A0AAI8VXX9_9PEZI|nr:Uu.00g012530.m01.CDS01 [Anthostomella pinea]
MASTAPLKPDRRKNIAKLTKESSARLQNQYPRTTNRSTDTMVTPRLARSPTCISCLRRLAQPPPSPLSLMQTQTRARTTKAELEDLQGIPVRLLADIPAFGRKRRADAIIRVKPGRMRNFWFPKALAEYMTRQRFKDMGLTEAAIGVRDRTFGSKLAMVDGEDDTTQGDGILLREDMPGKNKRKEVLTLPPEETQALLTTLLPDILTFARKPIAPAAPAEPTPAPEPTVTRSPSLAANAATSTTSSTTTTTPTTPTTPTSPEAEPAQQHTPIFGSVSTNDILALIKEKLLAADAQGSRVALEAEAITILGLDEEGDSDDRIKRLGTFEVLISPGRDLEPVRRVVEVVAEE